MLTVTLLEGQLFRLRKLAHMATRTHTYQIYDMEMELIYYFLWSFKCYLCSVSNLGSALISPVVSPAEPPLVDLNNPEWAAL